MVDEVRLDEAREVVVRGACLFGRWVVVGGWLCVEMRWEVLDIVMR